MAQAATGGERSGRGRGVLARIPGVLLVVLFGAASAQADKAAGPTAPVPAAVSGEIPAAAPPGAPGPSPAPSPRPAVAPSFNNDYALLLGVRYWDKADDFEPAIPAGASGRAGRFQPLGVDVEGSYHRRVIRRPGWDLLLGGDLGLFHHGNKEGYDVTILPSGRRVGGELSARGFYLFPSVKLFSGEPDPWRFSLGAGAGYVLVDFSNTLDDGMTADTFFRDESPGGYLSAGADRILSRSSMSLLLRVEAKVLFVDFGTLGEFAPGAGNLTGPVVLLQAGIAVAD